MKKTTLAIIITSAESFDAQRALMLPPSGGSEVTCSTLSTGLSTEEPPLELHEEQTLILIMQKREKKVAFRTDLIKTTIVRSES